MTIQIGTVEQFQAWYTTEVFVQIEGHPQGVKLRCCNRCGVIVGDIEAHMSYDHSIGRAQPMEQPQ